MQCLVSCCGFGLWFCHYCLVVSVVCSVVGWWDLFSLYCFVGGGLGGLLVILLPCYLVGLLGV